MFMLVLLLVIVPGATLGAVLVINAFFVTSDCEPGVGCAWTDSQVITIAAAKSIFDFTRSILAVRAEREKA